jgi:hypothetical protein
MNDLSLGERDVQVESKVVRLADTKLDLVKVSDASWLVRTPYEAGAKNWQLWIRFASNEVESLRIRLADSKNMQPAEAPADKSR